jgi:hypothetical protein
MMLSCATKKPFLNWSSSHLKNNASLFMLLKYYALNFNCLISPGWLVNRHWAVWGHGSWSRFEDMCAQMYYCGKMFGFVHLYNGQEAVSIGFIKLLNQADCAVSTYRDHIHAMSKGVPARSICLLCYCLHVPYRYDRLMILFCIFHLVLVVSWNSRKCFV